MQHAKGGSDQSSAEVSSNAASEDTIICILEGHKANINQKRNFMKIACIELNSLLLLESVPAYSVGTS